MFERDFALEIFDKIDAEYNSLYPDRAPVYFPIVIIGGIMFVGQGPGLFVFILKIRSRDLETASVSAIAGTEPVPSDR